MPLFPLNTVLFPGMPLPLHIFEPRYRLMIGRCLEGERSFGVAQMIEGEEGFSDTVPARVGTVAEILDVAPLSDGRLNLHTLGTRRFTILSTRAMDDYLVGTCQWLDDEAAPNDELWGLASQTRRMLSRYFDSLAQSVELRADLGELDVPQEPFALSMFIAAIMMLPSDQKQGLLELTSTRQRLELEESLLERADLVLRAFAKHLKMGFLQPPADESQGLFAEFISLN
ncbi:MAG: LON peptidase substrate-binding domain-containing protein [Armatimonadetes bacterium]|nr:LON peptidase substrate-binding domain-containing protein [Armatimonadota bacterium]